MWGGVKGSPGSAGGEGRCKSDLINGNGICFMRKRIAKSQRSENFLEGSQEPANKEGDQRCSGREVLGSVRASFIGNDGGGVGGETRGCTGRAHIREPRRFRQTLFKWRRESTVGSLIFGRGKASRIPRGRTPHQRCDRGE